MGKTSLVSAASDPTAVDVFVATGHCLPLSNEVSLLPLVDILQEIYEYDDGQWVERGVGGSPDHVRNWSGDYYPRSRRRRPRSRPTPAHLLLSGDRHHVEEPAIPTAVGAADRGPALGRPHHARPARTHAWLADPRFGVGTWRTEDSATSARGRRVADQGSPASHCDRGRAHATHAVRRPPSSLRCSMVTNPTAAEVETIHARSLGLPLFTEQLAAHAGHADELPSLLEDLLSQRCPGSARRRGWWPGSSALRTGRCPSRSLPRRSRSHPGNRRGHCTSSATNGSWLRPAPARGPAATPAPCRGGAQPTADRREGV